MPRIQMRSERNTRHSWIHFQVSQMKISESFWIAVIWTVMQLHKCLISVSSRLKLIARRDSLILWPSWVLQINIVMNYLTTSMRTAWLWMPSRIRRSRLPKRWRMTRTLSWSPNLSHALMNLVSTKSIKTPLWKSSEMVTVIWMG